MCYPFWLWDWYSETSLKQTFWGPELHLQLLVDHLCNLFDVVIHIRSIICFQEKESQAQKVSDSIQKLQLESKNGMKSKYFCSYLSFQLTISDVVHSFMSLLLTYGLYAWSLVTVWNCYEVFKVKQIGFLQVWILSKKEYRQC